MNHSFDIEIAKEYGIEEAILLNHFEFWLSKNTANKKHFHDDRYWTYNSLVALEELFPYMTARKIRTTIESLKEKGLILTGNYNANSYDRTMWYSLSDLGICILQKRQLHLTETANGNDAKVKPIPDTLQITNTDIVFAPAIAVVSKKTKSIPPAIEKVEEYCLERNNGISGQAFVDFYEARGWIVGKKKMVDWKAAVRTWENNRKSNPQNQFATEKPRYENAPKITKSGGIYADM